MSKLLIAAYFALAFVGTGFAQGNDVSGKWYSRDGEVLVNQNGPAIQAKLTGNSNCPSGGSRDVYFTGTLSGSSLKGTIFLCTNDQHLLEDCRLSDPYSADFQATVTESSIKVTYRPDYINFDKKDGHFTNCRVTPKGGTDRSFDLSRDDCCEQVQKLQQQVQDLTSRLQALEHKLTGDNVTLGSGSSSIQVGSGGITINSDKDITIKSTKNVVIKGATVTRN